MFPFAAPAIRHLNQAGARRRADQSIRRGPRLFSGIEGIFVKAGYGLGDFTWHSKTWPRQPDLITENLETAVDWILRDK